MNRDWWRKYFIPHSDNGYRPHILQEAAVLGMMLLIVITFVAANLQSVIWTASDWMVSTILPAVIVKETNREREELDLTPLVQNEKLAHAAQLKAEDMAANEYFSHYSPEGRTPWYWFGEVDYNYLHAGENLAIHFTDSSEVVDAWMNSPTHRDNIVNQNYSEIGIGTARGTYQGFPTVYVVQLFGTPKASVVTPNIATVNTVAASEPETETVSALESEPETTLVDTSSESGTAGETIVLSEATTEPEPEVVLTPEPIEDDSVLALGETATSVPREGSSTVAADNPSPASELLQEEPVVKIVNNEVVAYSNHLSTSTAGIPAAVTPDQNQVSTPATVAALTQPHRVLEFAYIIIGSFVALALMLSIVIEIRRQQPVQIAYGFGLMTAMLALFYIHMTLAGGVLIV